MPEPPTLNVDTKKRTKRQILINACEDNTNKATNLLACKD